jgi:hypothetical protein
MRVSPESFVKFSYSFVFDPMRFDELSKAFDDSRWQGDKNEMTVWANQKF